MTDIKIIRMVYAPRAAVYRAFTDPAQLARWSGPADVTFTEAAENERLAGEAGGMRLGIEFHDEPDGRTRLVLTQGPCPAELEGPARQGWSSSFTRLDKILAR